MGATAVGSPPSVVVMGVSGSGKSTVGSELARRLGVPFGDGDSLHAPTDVARMRAGQPLDDAARTPWLAAVGAWLAARTETGAVTACSALRRRHREQLRVAVPWAWFLHLDGDEAVLADRLAHRRGHFMPAALLPSQLATLEPLAPAESGLTVGLDQPVEAIVEAALRALSAQPRR